MGPGVPTFHNDVRVILRKSLVWDEAPGLFPALQSGPEMKSWARLKGLHSASLLGVPQTTRGTCSQAGHPSSRLWEPRGHSDLAPEITRTPPSSPRPRLDRPPWDPSQTTASGGTRPLPYCTTRGGKKEGGPENQLPVSGIRTKSLRVEAHLSEIGPFLVG